MKNKYVKYNTLVGLIEFGAVHKKVELVKSQVVILKGFSWIIPALCEEIDESDCYIVFLRYAAHLLGRQKVILDTPNIKSVADLISACYNIFVLFLLLI